MACNTPGMSTTEALERWELLPSGKEEEKK
jgi:hypothetical protein